MTPSVPVTIVGGKGGDLEAAQQGFSDRPGSEFMALGVFLMCSASLTLLLYQSTSQFTHADSFHCILCPVFHTCVAMALFGSAFNMAFLCSSIWVLICLPVSPMYTEPHSQGTLFIHYTLLFLLGVGALT